MKITNEQVDDFIKMSNAVRFLSIDAVQKANSGHPGMPMGMSDVATVLFAKHLKFDPADPSWIDRDRFVLSAGHGSMLLYSLLYLTGYNSISLNDIKNFRQFGSPTAGHPEFEQGSGIETTTGPLGQGLANSLGMAIAEKILESRYGKSIIDHNTYVIAGDGCLMEGISHEVISLAGHLGLGKLILLYDDNGISIDGPISLTMSDNTSNRFSSMGWHTQVIDGHDFQSIDNAITLAKKESNKPSIISCRTKIGFGSPNKEGKSSSHGSPLGINETIETKKRLNWGYMPFEIPDEILSKWKYYGSRSKNLRKEWHKVFDDNKSKNNSLDLLVNFKVDGLTNNILKKIKDKFHNEKNAMASRKASEEVLSFLVKELPMLIGGSADLSGSNNTLVESHKIISKDDFSGNYIHWGVREHCMAGAMNGISLHGGFIPYGGSFLVFSDYCRPSIRLSALMQQRVIYIFTHDSIGLGEDGPTHQPVEHLSSLRNIPNINILRPCDSAETAECWSLALERSNGPSVIALSRQALPYLRPNDFDIEVNYSAHGAYVLKDYDKAEVTIVATGSEVKNSIEASEKLEALNIKARVVSMPCMEVFSKKPKEYQKSILGTLPKIFIESATRQAWDFWIEEGDVFIGMSTFGKSAPADDLFNHFGINTSNIVAQALKVIK